MNNEHNNTDYNYKIIDDAITNGIINTNQMLDLFTNYYGLQILSNDFMEFVKNELE